MNDTDICRLKETYSLMKISMKSLDPVLLRANWYGFSKAKSISKITFDNVAYGPKIHGIVNSEDELTD